MLEQKILEIINSGSPEDPDRVIKVEVLEQLRQELKDREKFLYDAILIVSRLQDSLYAILGLKKL